MIALIFFPITLFFILMTARSNDDMPRSIYGIISAILFVLCALVFVPEYVDNISMVDACESDLPRNKYCHLIAVEKPE